MNRRELLKAGITLPFAGVAVGQVADDVPVGEELYGKSPYLSRADMDGIAFPRGYVSWDAVRKGIEWIGAEHVRFLVSPDAYAKLEEYWAWWASRINVEIDPHNSSGPSLMYIDGVRIERHAALVDMDMAIIDKRNPL